jgi:hypothetical protein
MRVTHCRRGAAGKLRGQMIARAKARAQKNDELRGSDRLPARPLAPEQRSRRATEWAQAGELAAEVERDKTR